jgi:hypothetical protein
MLCEKHLKERKSEIKDAKEKARNSRRDIADTFSPSWRVTELEEALKLAQSKNCCIDCITSGK